jgi:hypothetical protein
MWSQCPLHMQAMCVQIPLVASCTRLKLALIKCLAQVLNTHNLDRYHNLEF